MRAPQRLIASGLIAAGLLSPALVHAGDFDLDDDDSSAPANTAPPVNAPLPPAKHRTYSLAECLALADRNHPNIWAARARLGYARGQLDEARYTPWFNWSATAGTGVLPTVGGSLGYTSYNVNDLLNPSFASGYQPFFNFRIDINLPIFTFGKISSALDMAHANVRVSEWDMEKNRAAVRMDVRRAYFGVMFARDARYLSKEVIGKLDKAIASITERLDKGDTSVEEADKMRLVLYKDETLARSADADRGETYGLAALRFLTGVQKNFDIPDEPLKRPDTPIGPVVSYLAAARLFRPEVNMARAGVAARRGQLALQRARYFPDIGLNLNASYAVAPSIVGQSNAFASNNQNYFGYGFFIGARWSLDLVTNSARVEEVESQVEEARALERLALGGIGVEVEAAYAAVKEANTREQHWDHAEHKAREWIASVQSAIDLGTKDDRALIEPLRSYVYAKLEHTRALMDLNIAMSDLARVTGWDSAAPTGS